MYIFASIIFHCTWLYFIFIFFGALNNSNFSLNLKEDDCNWLTTQKMFALYLKEEWLQPSDVNHEKITYFPSALISVLHEQNDIEKNPYCIDILLIQINIHKPGSIPSLLCFGAVQARLVLVLRVHEAPTNMASMKMPMSVPFLQSSHR